MTTQRKLGDVDLRNYLRMVGAGGILRRTRAIAAGAACVLAFAAGRFGPWNGTNSHLLSLDDAKQLLKQNEIGSDEQKLAILAMFRHLQDGLDVLESFADRTDDVGMQANMAVGRMAESAAARVAKPASTSVNQRFNDDIIKRLDELIPRR